MGSWIGVYGANGYVVSQDGTIKNPSYATLAFSRQANWTWAASSNHLPALQKPEKPSDRIAGQWFSGNNFSIDVNLKDGQTHQVALYALDWDQDMRAETIKVHDASTGAVLDSRSKKAGTFIDGYYLVWNVNGHVTFEVDRNAGANATLSGVFFDSKTAQGGATRAVPVNDFLNSLGVDPGWIAIATLPPLFQYTGIRNSRGAPGNASELIGLHNKTIVPGVYPGVRYVLIGHNLPIDPLVSEGVTLANANALLAFEGPNEPNSFPITYKGAIGGGSHSWIPVAQYQRDLYAAVKANPTVKNYPVFATSVGGAENDNVGMQFLTIPKGAGTLMPDGTRYADYANPHNYAKGNGGCGVLQDNQAWNAADPILRGCWDNLSQEYGVTWYKKFPGYSDAQLQTLPRVTTETGWGTDSISEENQGKVLLNVYLAQFKRAWTYSFIYEFVDGGGSPASQGWGIYYSNMTPKLSATYIHNMTTILADVVSRPTGSMNYSIPAEPPTVHDLLMQKSDGTFYLAVWDERVPGTGTDNLNVDLGGPHASVTIYDPTAGTAAVQTLTNVSSIPLTLSDHPQILAISNP
jgi:hypothetical protein